MAGFSLSKAMVQKIPTSPLRYPVVDLHTHLLWSTAPTVVRQIARRNNVNDLPEHMMGEKIFKNTSFHEMLTLHRQLRPVFKYPRDFEDVAFSYLKFLASKGCIYTELIFTFSPENMERQGRTDSALYCDLLTCLSRAIDNARNAYGIEARLISTIARHHPLEEALQAAKMAAEHPFPYLTGFGMAGDEVKYPPQLFKEAFRIAHEEAGLHTTAHAGEWCGADGIWPTLELAGLERVGHGVRIVEDPDLVEEVVDRGITCEVCPTSNVVFGVFKSYYQLPIPVFRDRGVRFGFGSDDGPYHNTAISREYRKMAVTFGLSLADMLDISRQAIESAFLVRHHASTHEIEAGKKLRQTLLGKIEEYRNQSDFSERSAIFESQKSNRLLKVEHNDEGQAQVTWRLINPEEEELAPQRFDNTI